MINKEVCIKLLNYSLIKLIMMIGAARIQTTHMNLIIMSPKAVVTKTTIVRIKVSKVLAGLPVVIKTPM